MSFAGRVLSSGKGAPFVILAVSLLLMAPALIDSSATIHGDFYVYARWQAHFAQAFAQGDLYPRWLPDLNHGFGSPAFFIYPPLGQWLGALLGPVLPGAEAAGLRLILVLTGCLALGGWGALYWLRTLGLNKAAVSVGALVWLLAPYHAYLNLYQRGAFAELVAMTALPWGLAFSAALAQRRPLAWAGLTVSLAALLLSNAPTALFGAPFICVYGALLAERGDRLWCWALIVAAALVALGLSAAWLWPALTQVELVDQRILFNDIYQPANYLVFSASEWPNQGVRVATTAIFLIHVAILGFVLLAGGAGRGRKLMIAAVLLILLLVSDLSRPFWWSGAPWSRIQFAWRLLGLQSLLLAGLVAMSWQTARRKKGAISQLQHWIMPMLLLVDTVLLSAFIYHVRQRPVWPTQEVSAPRAEVREYWLGDVDKLVRRFGPHDIFVLEGRAEAGPLIRQGRAASFDVRAPEPSLIAVRQFDYTGWAYRIDGGDWAPTRPSKEPGGVATVAIPAGSHRIELFLPPMAAESLGIWLSWVSLGLLVLGVITDTVRRRLAG